MHLFLNSFFKNIPYALSDFYQSVCSVCSLKNDVPVLLHLITMPDKTIINVQCSLYSQSFHYILGTDSYNLGTGSYNLDVEVITSVQSIIISVQTL